MSDQFDIVRTNEASSLRLHFPEGIDRLGIGEFSTEGNVLGDANFRYVEQVGVKEGSSEFYIGSFGSEFGSSSFGTNGSDLMIGDTRMSPPRTLLHAINGGDGRLRVLGTREMDHGMDSVPLEYGEVDDAVSNTVLYANTIECGTFFMGGEPWPVKEVDVFEKFHGGRM